MNFKSIIFPIAFVAMRCLGTGAFFVPTMLAKIGHSAYISWLLTALGALSIGLIFVRLSSSSKSTTLSDLIANNFESKTSFSNVLLIIYTSSVLVGNALMFQIANTGIQGLLGDVDGVYIILIILVIMATFKESKILDLILSIAKILIMVCVPIIAIFLCNKVPLQVPTSLSVVGVAKGMMMTLFTFVGVESIMNDADLQPSDAKYGIIIGSAICLTIYLLNTYAVFNYVPDLLIYSVADQKIIQDAAPNMLPVFNVFLIFVGTTAINSWNLSLVDPLNNKIGQFKGKAFTKLVKILIALFAVKLFCEDRFLSSSFMATLIFHDNLLILSMNLQTILALVSFLISLVFKESTELVLSLATNLTCVIYLIGLIAFVKHINYRFSDFVLFVIGSIYVIACMFFSLYESYLIIFK